MFLSIAISARPVPQILSIKDKCTFLFSNILLIGLCNSLTNSLFCIIYFLVAPPKALYQKIYRPLKLISVKF